MESEMSANAIGIKSIWKMLANAKAFDILWIMYCENGADKVYALLYKYD